MLSYKAKNTYVNIKAMLNTTMHDLAHVCEYYLVGKKG